VAPTKPSIAYDDSESPIELYRERRRYGDASERKSTSSASPRPMEVAIEAMGLAAGGKMIQDIVADPNPSYLWNASRTRMINVHIFSPNTFEALTHIVPHPTPISAAAYASEGLPFFVVEEDPDNRLDGSETLASVMSVSVTPGGSHRRRQRISRKKMID
jgi:hypothetical protein